MADKEPKLETKSKQMINQTMNDPIKYLITGAAIALVCGTAGTIGGAWIMKDASGPRLQVRSQGPTINGQPSPITIQPASLNNPAFRSILPSTNVPQVRLPSQFTIPSGSINASGGRPQPLNSTAFQKVQGEPEVKAAREALVEAQKKYMASMQTATAKADPNSGAKATPITIRVPPSASATNGTAKTKL